MNTPQASMNTNPDNTTENTMTTKKQIRQDPRNQTLFFENLNNAAAIDKLEIAITDWDLEEKSAVESAEYLGYARWEYRNSHIEGMWVPGGSFEFLAISDDLEVEAAPSRQFKKFSQATTWIDGVYTGAEIAQIPA